MTFARPWRPLIAEIKKNIETHKGTVDAIFLAGYLPVAAEIIKQARAMGVTIPFLGGLGLDDLGLVRVAGAAANGVIVPSLFNPRSLSHVTRTFVRRFKEEYFTVPDTWNAQGYDAVQVLMHAIEKSDSTVPKRVSTTLRYLPRWNGVTGSYRFLQNGDITGKKLFYKEVVNGQFVYLERKSDWDVNPTTVLPDITIRLPLDNVVETIDPGLAIGKNAFEIIEQLFMGLTGFAPQTYQPVPELAVEWRASEDGHYYLFRLRGDAQWSNGDKVTAHDVVWAIQRNIQLEIDDARALDPLLVLKNARALRKGYIKDASKIGVKAIDDFTLWFELEKPCVFFPTLTALPVYHPLPRGAIEKHADKWTEPANIEINGPYQLIYWEKGVQSILKKNPHYCEAAKVRIPQVHYFILPVNQVGLNMYRDNQLDLMGGDFLALPAGELANVLEHPMLLSEYSQQPLLYTYTYMFNPKPPLDNVLVRKAISAAINRKLLIQLIIQGGETAATTFTTPPAFGAVETHEEIGVAFNPIQARKWLAAAGYPYGRDFPEISLLHPQSEKDALIATAIQTFLRHYLNIKVRLDQREPDAFKEALQNPADLQLFLLKARGSFPDASAWFNMILNFYSWDKIVYDPSAAHVQFLINSALARKVKDPKKRKKLFELAEKIICERECVVAPVFFGSGNYLVKKRVKDWSNMAFGGQHIRNWRLESDD